MSVCISLLGASHLDSRSCSLLIPMAIGRLKGTGNANLQIKFIKTNEEDIGNISGDLELNFGLKSLLLSFSPARAAAS